MSVPANMQRGLSINDANPVTYRKVLRDGAGLTTNVSGVFLSLPIPLSASDTVRVKAYFGAQAAKVAPSNVSWF